MGIAVTPDDRMAGEGMIRPDPAFFESSEKPYEDDGLINPDQADSSRLAMSLAGHIRTGLEEAQRHRQNSGIDARFASCLRRYSGEYEPDILETIKRIGGSKMFRRLTAHKADDLQAWLEDILRPIEDRIFDAVPSSKPELSQSDIAAVQQSIVESVTQSVSMLVESGGGMIPPDEVQAMTLEELQTAYQGMEDMLEEKAKAMAERMADTIDDQHEDGDYIGALYDFLEFFKVYPVAYFKGPFLTKRKMMKHGKDGTVGVEDRIVMSWKAVSPLNVWHSPYAKSCQDGEIFEREPASLADLHCFIGQPGYDEQAIREILKSGLPASAQNIGDVPIDYETNPMLIRPEAQSEYRGAPNELIHFAGSVQGRMLSEWGMNGIEDQDASYEVYAIYCAGRVIRAVLNENPLGTRIYNSTSFKPVPDSIYGMSLPESMADVQDGANAFVRSAVNSGAMAAMPLVEIDVSALPDGVTEVPNIRPGYIHQYDGSKIQASGRSGVKFTPFPSVVEQCLRAYADFKKEADDVTGIPAFVSGSGAIEGAGETLGGLEILAENAAKGIRRSYGNIGRHIILPSLRHQAMHNMLYSPDKAIKGDVSIQLKGPLAVIARQQSDARIGAWLDSMNNPADMEIVDLPRRAKLRRRQAQAFGFTASDGIVPTDKEMSRKMADLQAQAQQQAVAEAQGGGNPKEKAAA